jgi:Mg2+ and Co2+ transporter CorA
MNIFLYSFKDQEVQAIKNELPIEKWRENADWVDIESNDKKKVATLLEYFKFVKENKKYIITPSSYYVPKTDGECIIQNITISKIHDIYNPEHLTLVIFNDLIINIIPENSNLNLKNLEIGYLKKSFKHLHFYFIYALSSIIIAEDINHINLTRKRLHKMENKLINFPDKLTSSEVMTLRKSTEQLADIIEDQFVGYNILISLFVDPIRKKDISKLKIIIDDFRELNRIVIRLEEKAESFRKQFMLIQQEISAKKINTLTIIQAIFVPITFLAGVYGMNFQFMPELSGKYSYFIVWGLFILIAGISLFYFKKNKWFD